MKFALGVTSCVKTSLLRTVFFYTKYDFEESRRLMVLESMFQAILILYQNAVFVEVSSLWGVEIMHDYC